MVREYLLHYGYGETLHAFDREMGSCCQDDDPSEEGGGDAVMEDVVGGSSGAVYRGPVQEAGPCR
jgi:hypothetical protein